MVFGFKTTCAIGAYHHLSCEFEPCSWRGMLDTTLCDKFVSDLWQVNGFLRVLCFPPRYSWNIVKSDVKHHKPTQPLLNFVWKLTHLNALKGNNSCKSYNFRNEIRNVRGLFIIYTGYIKGSHIVNNSLIIRNVRGLFIIYTGYIKGSHIVNNSLIIDSYSFWVERMWPIDVLIDNLIYIWKSLYWYPLSNSLGLSPFNCQVWMT